MNQAMREVLLYGGEHEHVGDLSTGTDGTLRLTYRMLGLQQIFASMIAERCFEACEFSLANYLILRSTGQDWLTAVPVFPYRAFRHALAVTRRDSALTDLAQLAGRRVALEDYSMTAAVWVRALLSSDYGVDHRSITWVTRRAQRLPIPAGARVERTDADLESLLLAGEVDAMLGFGLRDARLPEGDRQLRTLLPDAETAARAYCARTGIFPIHHCVVVRNDVLAELPQLPRLLSDAYTRAKTSAYARRASSVLPWGDARWEQDMAAFGGDPLPYGWNAGNRRVVGMLAEALREQEFIASVPALDSLFVT
jgi:4,5-dihydroxyphthalate decarboxylase